MTTIEYCEKSMKKTAYDTSSYDRGYLGNIKGTLGDEVWLWFLPLNPPTGTGLAYVTEDMRLLRDAEVGRNLPRRPALGGRPSARPAAPLPAPRIPMGQTPGTRRCTRTSLTPIALPLLRRQGIPPSP